MNFQILVVLSTASLVALVAQAQITIGSDFKASSTLQLGGLASPELLNNMTSVGRISGSSLDSSCAFPVRQIGVWKDPSTGRSGVTPLGSFGKGGVSLVWRIDVADRRPIARARLELDVWLSSGYTRSLGIEDKTHRYRRSAYFSTLGWCTSRWMGFGTALEPKTVWDVWVGVAWSYFTGFGSYKLKYGSDHHRSRLVAAPTAVFCAFSETEHAALLFQTFEVIFDKNIPARYRSDDSTLRRDGHIHSQ
ncbi:hypothetical protein ONZ45_g9246 [Pleurotus djamor]|nr:hypothetical protein ONZ45_g9246 [Pleurotus djamor]